mmetsp:Transcript_7645/g.15732  ORF Transcript_7645/g.15732 Transcript_7645/m.15732 type:complete len:200 (-) Transcript_7645:223-822(-)
MQAHVGECDICLVQILSTAGLLESLQGSKESSNFIAQRHSQSFIRRGVGRKSAIRVGCKDWYVGAQLCWIFFYQIPTLLHQISLQFIHDASHSSYFGRQAAEATQTGCTRVGWCWIVRSGNGSPRANCWIVFRWKGKATSYQSAETGLQKMSSSSRKWIRQDALTFIVLDFVGFHSKSNVTITTPPCCRLISIMASILQ